MFYREHAVAYHNPQFTVLLAIYGYISIDVLTVENNIDVMDSEGW